MANLGNLPDDILHCIPLDRKNALDTATISSLSRVNRNLFATFNPLLYKSIDLFYFDKVQRFEEKHACALAKLLRTVVRNPSRAKQIQRVMISVRHHRLDIKVLADSIRRYLPHSQISAFWDDLRLPRNATSVFMKMFLSRLVSLEVLHLMFKSEFDVVLGWLKPCTGLRELYIRGRGYASTISPKTFASFMALPNLNKLLIEAYSIGKPNLKYNCPMTRLDQSTVIELKLQVDHINEALIRKPFTLSKNLQALSLTHSSTGFENIKDIHGLWTALPSSLRSLTLSPIQRRSYVDGTHMSSLFQARLSGIGHLVNLESLVITPESFLGPEWWMPQAKERLHPSKFSTFLPSKLRRLGLFIPDDYTLRRGEDYYVQIVESIVKNDRFRDFNRLGLFPYYSYYSYHDGYSQELRNQHETLAAICRDNRVEFTGVCGLQQLKWRSYSYDNRELETLRVLQAVTNFADLQRRQVAI